MTELLFTPTSAKSRSQFFAQFRQNPLAILGTLSFQYFFTYALPDIPIEYSGGTVYLHSHPVAALLYQLLYF